MWRPSRQLSAILLVVALGAGVVALIVICVGAVFYALTALSGPAFVEFLVAACLAMAAMTLLHRVVLPFARRQWDNVRFPPTEDIRGHPAFRTELHTGA